MAFSKPMRDACESDFEPAQPYGIATITIEMVVVSF
jgi:hypothetical protein